MLDVKRIRQNPDEVRRAVQNRGGRYLPLFDEFIQVDKEWRVMNAKLDELRAQSNAAADKVGELKKQKQDAGSILQEMASVKKAIKGLEESIAPLTKKIDEIILQLPNTPDPSVPVGKNADENPVVREWGTRRSFPFEPKDHQDIGAALGFLDFERASKLSGSRFALLMGDGARLERALIQFMLDVHTREHGYLEVLPPFLVTGQTMTGTGQLPKFAEELYKCAEDDLYLIPTAEVPLTNLHRDETFSEESLPKSYCSYTACFRREAGSYGKDTRGLIRNHQFNKVELVKFVRPEDASAELETLTRHAETILQKLDLPYRVIQLCTGDLGFSSAKTYDLEIWMPGDLMIDEKNKTKSRGRWREVSSCSVFTDFQARRINIRLKKKDGSRGYPYTLNGSGLAVGRTMAAILENYQEADGAVAVPKVLQPYLQQERLSARGPN
ncbi:MAG TPA: serine--tRNA ligase [Elusimicrobiota bacterium]|nr:serine--tRNA ligase [Elusimicrobiota bacterium]